MALLRRRIRNHWVSRTLSSLCSLGAALIAMGVADVSAQAVAENRALRIDIEIEELSKLGIPMLEQIKTLGPIRGSARVSVVDQKLRFDDLRMRVASDGAELEVTGTVGDAVRWREVNLAVTLNAPSGQWLTAGARAIGKGPLKITGNVRSDGAALRFTDLLLLTATSRVTGSLTSVAEGNVQRITGMLDAPTLNVDEFQSPAEPSRGKSQRLLQNVPLPLDPTPELELELTLNVDRLTMSHLLFEHTSTSIESNAATSRLSSSGDHAGGRYEATLLRKQVGADVETTLQSTLAGVSWEQASIQLGFDDYMDGGPTDAQIDVHGRGETTHEVLASMNGHVLMRAGESSILNPALREAGTDFLENMVGLFTPAQDRAGTTQVKCMAMRLDVRDGVAYADHGLVVLTDKVSLAGSGTIDLRDERLSLDVALTAHEGITFSKASLAGGATVTGTLADPQVAVSGTNVATTAVSVAGSVATGGLWFLGKKLINATTTGAQTCSNVLKEAPPETAGETPAPTGEKGEDSGVPVIRGIGRGLKKLFGQ